MARKTNNLLIANPPPTRPYPNPMWLTLGDDQGQRAPSYFGDGWTQDFLNSFGLKDRVRFDSPNHFRDHGALYLPVFTWDERFAAEADKCGNCGSGGVSCISNAPLNSLMFFSGDIQCTGTQQTS